MKYIFTLILILHLCVNANAQQNQESIAREYSIDTAFITHQRYMSVSAYVTGIKGNTIKDAIITHRLGSYIRQTKSDENGYFQLDSVLTRRPAVTIYKKGEVRLMRCEFSKIKIENLEKILVDNQSMMDINLVAQNKDNKVPVRTITGQYLKNFVNNNTITSTLFNLFNGGWDMVIFNGMTLMTSSKEDADAFINTLDSKQFNYITRINLGENGEKYDMKGVKGMLIIKYGAVN